jgi:PAS domain S-box-containing protein/putative nucleotidyltransferase with HDIG domain
MVDNEKKRVLEKTVQQRLANEALVNSELRYRRLFETAKDGILILDADTGLIIDANPFMVEILGYPLDKFIGKQLWELGFFKDIIGSQTHFLKLKQDKYVRYEDLQLKTADGRGIDVEFVSNIYQVGDKQVIQCNIRDITERKRTEEELKFRAALLDSATDSIMVMSDDEKKIIYANNAAYSSLGYGREEFIGKGLQEFILPSLERMVPEVDKKAEDKGIAVFESINIRKDKSLIPVEVHGSFIESDGEKFFIAISHDITERKKAENELAVEHRRMEMVTSNVGVGLALISKDYRTVWANNVLKSMFGEVEGEICYSTYNKLPDICPWCGVKRVFETGEERVETEAHGFDNNGNEVWSKIVATPFRNENGEITGALEVVIPITESKRAEEALKQSNAALLKTMDDTVQAMAVTCEMRDPYTAGHQHRVAQLAVAIAEELHLSDKEKKGIRVASLLHDIGKMSIPAEILNKPGKLSQIEFNLVKMHVQAGYDILEGIEFPWPVARIVYQHHERMDGSGYPAALAGKDIMIEAKILSVADTVEAMVSHRPYRAALGIDKALEEISLNRGKLYDADVVDACLKVFGDKGFIFE